MGREIKRVPLNFAWPLNEPWSGYLNPHYKGHCSNCSHCDGTGYSDEYNQLMKKWYGNAPFTPEERGSTPFLPTHPAIVRLATRNTERAWLGSAEREAQRLAAIYNSAWCHHLNNDDVKALIKAGRLYDFTHTFVAGKGWVKKKPAYTPTAREVNEWSLRGFGHDSINAWKVVSAECERLGHPKLCSHCKGEASIWDSKENRTRANRWRRKEPPKGAGYQLWETVSEGSPISPVFKTPELLADWLTKPGNGWKTDQGTTREQWLRFINGPGWAPSLVVSAQTGVVSGVQAMTTAP